MSFTDPLDQWFSTFVVGDPHNIVIAIFGDPSITIILLILLLLYKTGLGDPKIGFRKVGRDPPVEKQSTRPGVPNSNLMAGQKKFLEYTRAKIDIFLSIQRVFLPN